VTTGVFPDKVLDDVLLEPARTVEQSKGDAQAPCDAPRILYCLRRATTVVSSRPWLAPQVQHQAGHVVSLLNQQCSGHGAIYSAAHSDDDSPSFRHCVSLLEAWLRHALAALIGQI
jgi:hypothetical protein